MAFEGYTEATVDFLWGIRFNNDRAWFLPRKEIYQKELLEPTRALGTALYEGLSTAHPELRLHMRVSRIYRDARRLHGRGPYKDHLWLCIDSGEEDWTGKPAFWFEIAPEAYSYGMGFWCAAPELMAHYRRGIDQHPEELTALAEDLERRGIFTLTGQEYARSKGDPPAALRAWYQKKSLALEFSAPLEERLFHPELAQEVLADLETLVPLYRYFDRLVATMPRDNTLKRG